MDQEHKQVTVTYKQMSGEMDEELAPLILALWKRDIIATRCCQEIRPGWARIQFVSAMEAENFIKFIVKKYSDDIESLYQRVMNPELENSWEYDIDMDDFNISYNVSEDDLYEETHLGKPEFIMNVNVTFPRSDLPEIFKKFKVKSNIVVVDETKINVLLPNKNRMSN